MKRSRSPKTALEVVYQRRRGALVGFAVRGHAGFAPAGQDIVCAGVSALVLSAAHGLRKHCGAKPIIKNTRRRYALALPGAHNPEAQAVLATMLSGLQAIARSYPGSLRVKQGRVQAA